MDGATVLFFRDAVYNRLWSGVRAASSRPGAGSIWIDHLQIHGAHPAVCLRPHLYPGDHHHTHAGHLDIGRSGAANVPALRKLHLDCMAHGAPPPKTDCRLIACTIRVTNFSSARSRLRSAQRSARFYTSAFIAALLISRLTTRSDLF